MPAAASGMLALPCVIESGFLLRPRAQRLCDCFESRFQRAAHHHRRRRGSGVTLVVCDENARQECFEGGAAVAR
jgi:hypothetical protein